MPDMTVGREMRGHEQMGRDWAGSRVRVVECGVDKGCASERTHTTGAWVEERQLWMYTKHVDTERWTKQGRGQA